MSKARGKRKRFRSGFEETILGVFTDLGIPVGYETKKVKYLDEKRYTPDFLVLDKGVFVETKGYFKASDRHKHLLIREQHPELDIRFLFMNANNKIHKSSTTTYADWCDKHGFKWANKTLPKEWIDEFLADSSLPDGNGDNSRRRRVRKTKR